MNDDEENVEKWRISKINIPNYLQIISKMIYCTQSQYATAVRRGDWTVEETRILLLDDFPMMSRNFS